MFKRILTVVDAKDAGASAVTLATGLAGAQGGDLVLVHVLPQPPITVHELSLPVDGAPTRPARAEQAEASRLLGEAAQFADSAGVMHHRVIARGRDPVQSIVDVARHRRCDLIVVPSEKQNALLRLLTGSAIPGLITATPIPLLVCKASPERPVRLDKVLIAIEPRQAAWAAVTLGLEVARSHGAHALFAFVQPRQAMPLADMQAAAWLGSDVFDAEVRRFGGECLDRAMAQASEQGVAASAVTVDAMDPATALAQLAAGEGAGLICVACQHQNAVVRLLAGSVVPGLVTASRVPVLICRDEAPDDAGQRRRKRRRYSLKQAPPESSPTLRTS